MRDRMAMRLQVGLALLLAVIFGPAQALVPEFTAPARISEARVARASSYALPVGPFAGGTVPTETVEGAVTTTVWQVESRDVTSLDLLAPLRDQVRADGYEIRFECADVACGGFDFRFATRVVPEPAMHVDLADYRFLAATRKGPGGVEAISILVSRSALVGFVQVIEVGPSAAPVVAPVAEVEKPAVPDAPPSVTPSVPGDIGAALAARGSVVLEDVVFASGASVLAAEPIASLDALAEWLKQDATRVVVVVGHTDASGGLAGNVALGARRADAIRGRLVATLGVRGSQVAGEGVGYLAPRATNLTEEGRRLNRRVEVVLVPPTPAE